jgi:hypothetical protein
MKKFSNCSAKKSKSSKKRLDKVLGKNQENCFEPKTFHISSAGASDSKP